MSIFLRKMTNNIFFEAKLTSISILATKKAELCSLICCKSDVALKTSETLSSSLEADVLLCTPKSKCFATCDYSYVWLYAEMVAVL